MGLYALTISAGKKSEVMSRPVEGIATLVHIRSLQRFCFRLFLRILLLAGEKKQAEQYNEKRILVHTALVLEGLK
jgi:hypothetical protein